MSEVTLNVEEVGNELKVELIREGSDKPSIFYLGAGKAYYDNALALMREICDLDPRDKEVKKIISKYRADLYGF
jgi:hypothetical protein